MVSMFGNGVLKFVRGVVVMMVGMRNDVLDFKLILLKR